MSRPEHNESVNTLTQYDDENNRPLQAVFSQSHCSYCYDNHVDNQVGLVSLNHKAWFCSGACMSMFNHDNKFVSYSQGVIAVLEDMRKKHYNPERIATRKKKYNYYSH